jgi:hypothetical protein
MNILYRTGISHDSHLASHVKYSTVIQCSKWAGTCQYTISELLLVPEFHTGIFQYILYPFTFFPLFWWYILISLLRGIPALLNFHLKHFYHERMKLYIFRPQKCYKTLRSSLLNCGKKLMKEEN